MAMALLLKNIIKKHYQKNIIKARNFRFARFFRAPDLKTDTMPINIGCSDRRTIFRMIDLKIVSKKFVNGGI